MPRQAVTFTTRLPGCVCGGMWLVLTRVSGEEERAEVDENMVAVSGDRFHGRTDIVAAAIPEGVKVIIILMPSRGRPLSSY